jgi:hypothetical protein
MRTIEKRPHELRVGDRILGATNFYTIETIRFTGLSGTLFPVIEIVDMNGIRKTVDTGSTPQLQDHIYECDPRP